MDANHEEQAFSRLPLILAGGLIFVRLVSLLSMSLEGLRGYGDFTTFFSISSLPGWPFLHYWVEFPPVFPFLNALLNRLSGGQEHVYDYLLALFLLLVDAGNLYLFARLARRLFSPAGVVTRCAAYFLVLVSVAYSWWYFDPLGVFWMLLGLLLLLERRFLRAGGAIGLGIATKLFPGLVLLAAWGRVSWRKLAGLAALSLAPLLVIYGILWQASPGFTMASIRSQGAKGSWETAWALLDGNVRTGNFGALADRLDPAKVSNAGGNPAVIPPLASLVVFAGLGLLGCYKAGLLTGRKAPEDHRALALVGFGLGLFMLWSPGWSPQWVLYLLPLVLLVLPTRQALLLGAALVLVNLLEWPVLLSRGFFWAMWATILMRTMLLIILTLGFFQEMTGQEQEPARAATNEMV